MENNRRSAGKERACEHEQRKQTRKEKFQGTKKWTRTENSERALGAKCKQKHLAGTTAQKDLQQTVTTCWQTSYEEN